MSFETHESWYAVAIMTIDEPYLFYKWEGGCQIIGWTNNPFKGSHMPEKVAATVLDKLRNGAFDEHLEDWAKSQDYQMVKVNAHMTFGFEVMP